MAYCSLDNVTKFPSRISSHSGMSWFPFSIRVKISNSFWDEISFWYHVNGKWSSFWHENRKPVSLGRVSNSYHFQNTAFSRFLAACLAQRSSPMVKLFVTVAAISINMHNNISRETCAIFVFLSEAKPLKQINFVMWMQYELHSGIMRSKRGTHHAPLR